MKPLFCVAKLALSWILVVVPYSSNWLYSILYISSYVYFFSEPCFQVALLMIDKIVVVHCFELLNVAAVVFMMSLVMPFEISQ